MHRGDRYNSIRSRATTSTESAPITLSSATGVSIPSTNQISPSAANDESILQTLTMSTPLNIQLASCPGFINTIPGNVVDGSMTLSGTNNKQKIASSISLNKSGGTNLNVNVYNLYKVLDKLYLANNINYNISSLSNFSYNTDNSSASLYVSTDAVIDLVSLRLITSNPAPHNNIIYTMSIKNIATFYGMILDKGANVTYKGNDVAFPTEIYNMLQSSILPLSIINAMCIGFDVFLQDCIRFSPLINNNPNTYNAVLYYTQSKLFNYLNNVILNIPNTNPQATNNIVAAAAENVSNLQSQLSSLTQSQSQLDQQLQASEASLNNMTSQYNSNNSQLQQVQDQLQQTQSNDTTTINNLNAQTQALQSQINNLNSAITNETNLYNKTLSNLNLANTQINSLQTQLTSDTKLINSLDEKLTNNKSYIKELYILLFVFVLIIAYLFNKSRSMSASKSGGYNIPTYSYEQYKFQ